MATPGAAVAGHSGALAAGRGVAHLSKHQQAVAAKVAARGGAVAEGESKRKGLRHFAVRVSRKVEEKSVTTYNEVADELVVEEKEIKQQEMESGGKAAAALQKKLTKSGSLVDEKNIRRRVYDSLNVLMAMGIIEKDKKLISWRGLAMARSGGGHREVASMQLSIEKSNKALALKRARFIELEEQATTLAGLIRRNAHVDSLPDAVSKEEHAPPQPQSTLKSTLFGPAESTPRSFTGAANGTVFVRDGQVENDVTAVGAFTAESNELKAPPLSGNGSPETTSVEGGATHEAENAGLVPVLTGEADGEEKPTNSSPGLTMAEPVTDRIPIPFIIVAVGDDAQIEMEMDQMREDVSFTFSSPFAVFDDREVLRRMDVSVLPPQR